MPHDKGHAKTKRKSIRQDIQDNPQAIVGNRQHHTTLSRVGADRDSRVNQVVGQGTATGPAVVAPVGTERILAGAIANCVRQVRATLGRKENLGRIVVETEILWRKVRH